jgi:hypothetical protein
VQLLDLPTLPVYCSLVIYRIYPGVFLMAWFLLARLVFTAAVAYTAFLLRPLGTNGLTDAVFGLALALIAVLFELRLRDLALTSLFGALLGGTIGLLMAKGIGAALF